MADSNFIEKPLLEKIWELLEREPEHYDVAFCVGKEKKIVRALKILLKASSPFLKKEFENGTLGVIKEGDVIPLPDFDCMAFELFVKLTSLDTWSLEVLKALNMPLIQVLNLLSICRCFQIKKAEKNLKILAKPILEFFDEFKDTDDFLQLSQTNLKSVLVSNDIGIKEVDVFHAAMRWADFQCQEMKVKPTKRNLRKILGDCLYEIRFPVMTFAEFTKTVVSKDILTAAETSGISKFIGLKATKKLSLDATKKLPFETAQRKLELSSELLPSGPLTLSLTQGFEIVEKPWYYCDGSKKVLEIACDKEITVYGLGFLGPVETGGYYDVKVQIKGLFGARYKTGMLEKRIYCRKDETLYFIFDAPIDMHAATSFTKSGQSYEIHYFLKDYNTSACNRKMNTEIILQEGDTKFRLKFDCQQLAEILFRLR